MVAVSINEFRFKAAQMSSTVTASAARQLADGSSEEHGLVSDELVNEEVFANLSRYHTEFQTAQPFKHVVIDAFLKPEIAEAMLAEFPTVADPSLLLNEFGAPNPKAHRSDVRSLGDSFRRVDDYIQSSGFLKLMTEITGIPDLRYDPWYYGAGTHENFHGAGLDAHYDFNIHPRTAQHRRLNAIVYLNKDWQPEWRGDINFHTDPWDLAKDKKKTVQPLFNRCVLFETTERSWHSVTTVTLPDTLRNKGRKSFTIYLYTDKRPADETAPEHGTVYVQGGLPDHIKVGHTLDQNDMNEIHDNLTRRQEYLRNLYKREYRFSSVIEELKAQISALRRHIYVPVTGYAKVREVLEPPFLDGWMGSSVAFELEPCQPILGIHVNGWRPHEWQDEVEITVRLDDRSASSKVQGGIFTVSLPLDSPITASCRVSVEVSGVQKADGGDDRLVSMMLGSIELVH